MAGISKLVDDALEKKASNALKSLGRDAEIANKLKAIIATRSYGVTTVATIFNITRMTLSSWIKHFKTGGVTNLVPKTKKPKDTKLSLSQKEAIEVWVTNDPQITIRGLKGKILKEFNVSIGMTATHKILQKLKFAYITPRPRHYKQDTTLIEEFKKKS